MAAPYPGPSSMEGMAKSWSRTVANSFAHNVEKPAKSLFAYRNFDSVACGNNIHILAKSF